MATFAIETVIVVPDNNSLPSSGTTSDLTAGQFGIFLPDYTPATAVTAASAKYLYLAQGRGVYAPGEGTKRSDKIYAKNIIEWYKMTGQPTASLQMTRISDLTAKCDEDITITFRLHSMYIDTAYFNGLTQSVMATTPCCDCGADPCDTLGASDIQDVMTELATKINEHPLLSKYLVANITGSGASTTIVVGALALDAYGNACDLTSYPYQFDRIRFNTFVHNGPTVTTDYEVADACNTVATVTVLQRSSYPRFTPDEVAQIEKDFWSYQSEYKHIFSSPLYNGEFHSFVDDTVANYDKYYLKFKHEEDAGFAFKQQLDEAIQLYIPTGDTAATEAILVAAFGTPVNESPATSTTTTSTTTTTTSTTTTTTLIP